MPLHQQLGKPVGPYCLARLQRPSGSFCFHKVWRENTLVITSGNNSTRTLSVACRGILEQFEVSNTGSWIARSLVISSAIGLLTWAGFYLFFRVHQELDIQPAYAFKLGAIAFVLSAIVALIYFRNRAGAR